jgi:hypothetical protein
MNDKCAGGTGRFLEMIAEVLNTPLEEIGELSLASRNTIPFNTICAVFAKSEAIAYLRKGVAKSDILAGLHEAIAARSLNLLKRVSIQKDFSITGGIAKNSGMVAKLTEKVGLEPLLCESVPWERPCSPRNAARALAARGSRFIMAILMAQAITSLPSTLASVMVVASVQKPARPEF